MDDKRCTTSGNPITPDHREIDSVTGQQKDYIIICAEDRAKGFVRPYRTTYLHSNCGTTTIMNKAISETYARNPKFYSGTFCVKCKEHFPLNQFTWVDDGSPVGS